MSRWIADDPHPEYSRLDRLDGLGEPLPARTYAPRRRRKFFAFILECVGILAIMTTTLFILYAAYTWL